MNIQGLTNAASAESYSSVFALRKGMDLQQDMQQQLLASLPPAPSAEPHKGQHVDRYI